MFAAKTTITLALAVCIGVACAQADTMYLRDGWDPVNNVADSNGYDGTRAAYGDWTDDDTVYDASSEIKIYRDRGDYDSKSGAVLDFVLPQELTQVAGSDVSSATLTLTYTDGWQGNGTTTYNVRDVADAWVEGEATYNNADASTAWSEGYIRQANLAVLSSKAVTGNNMDGVTFDLDVTALVQSWIDDPSSQKGIAVSIEEWRESYLNSHLTLASYDNENVSERPMLTVEYVPEPLTALLVAGAAPVFFRRKRHA